VALFYLDTSALVKLVREEQQSNALSLFVEGADIVSSELVLAELPRAIRRAVANDPELSLDALIEQAGDVLDALAILPIDQAILDGAGGLPEPALRTLDAIHVAAALTLSPIDAFVTYDERQSAAARLAGLRTVTPSEPAVSLDAEEVVELSEPSETIVRSIRDYGE
jgi:predicted nucleic acid-binding protein